MDLQDIIQLTQSVENYDGPSDDHISMLSRLFGHKEFRRMQWKIINSILKDRRDNFAVMSTGYGKSLCYQFPPVYTNGVAIVISPLISLMEDQVLSLQMANIPACLLGTANKDSKETINDIFRNKYRLIYITPEYCCGDSGFSLIDEIHHKLNLVLIAIDEAHCVSSWGHDFRKSYRALGKLKGHISDVPILAVTATATTKVRSDIISSLHLRNPNVLCSGFDRPNLYFTVNKKGSSEIDDIRKCMTCDEGKYFFPGSTIIYCLTRKKCEELHGKLKLHGLNCGLYHAGLSLSERKETHELFIKDKVNCVIATIAFGMGIDKHDVRNVIHYGASKDIESYYQEVGRAGRDGQPSNCTVYFCNQDFIIHNYLRQKSELFSNVAAHQANLSDIMQEYLYSTECRRKFILNYFGDNTLSDDERKRCCDNCTRNLSNKDDQYDFAKDALIILSAIDALGSMYGMETYVLFLKGSKNSKLQSLTNNKLFGSGKDKSNIWWKAMFLQLIGHKYLKMKTIRKAAFSYNTYEITDIGYKYLKNADDTKKLLLNPVPEISKLLKEARRYEEMDKRPLDLEDLRLMAVDKFSHSSTIKGAPSDQNSEQEIRKPMTVSIKPISSEEAAKDLKLRKALYHALVDKRNDIADDEEWLPYKVASDTALMEMAKHKPKNLAEFRNLQLDGYTELKINKFGQLFIDVINEGCKPPVATGDGLSIQRELLKNKYSKFNVQKSAYSTLDIYMKGYSIEQIAKERGLAVSTISGHLFSCMEAGFPIHLKYFGVTKEIFQSVYSCLKDKNFPGSLKWVKENLTIDIEYDKIRAIHIYVKLREYLKELNAEYTDFETINYIDEVNIASEEQSISTHDQISEESSAEERLTQQSALDALIGLTSEDFTEMVPGCSKVVLDNSYEAPPAKVRKLDVDSDSDDSIIF